MPEAQESEIYKKYSEFKRYLLELGWCRLPHSVKFDEYSRPSIECVDKIYCFNQSGKLLKVILKKMENPQHLYKIQFFENQATDKININFKLER